MKLDPLVQIGKFWVTRCHLESAVITGIETRS